MIRILLVEDEPLTRAAVSEMLEDAGFDVTATCTADEAVILLAEEAFGLLLTDVMMPGEVDGVELAGHAREVHPGLPVVFVSGRPDMELRARLVGEPVAFFGKPYDGRTLVSEVGRMARSDAAGRFTSG